MALRRRWLRVTLIRTTGSWRWLVGVTVANRFAGPLPPRRLVISTGREDGDLKEGAWGELPAA